MLSFVAAARTVVLAFFLGEDILMSVFLHTCMSLSASAVVVVVRLCLPRGVSVGGSLCRGAS